MVKRNQRGITLIALVITIIVLLILAGVTINVLLGDNGIIGRTQTAATEHEKAAVLETLKLAVAEGEMECHTNPEISKKVAYQTALENSGATITSATDEKIEGTIARSNKTYKFEVNVTTGEVKLIDEGGIPTTPPGATTYTVTFKDGETTLSTATVEDGQTVTKPADPTKDGFEFVNWYSDSEFTTEYDFASIINGDTTIYAKWTETATVSTNPSATPNIAANAAKNIGDYGKVINYTPTNPSGVESPGTVSEWRLFYADESNAYLIGSSLDNTTKALHTLPNFSSMTAVSDLGKSLNPKYTTWTLQTTSGKWSFNLNAVAALTDTSSTSPWKAYESSDTNWAIGGVPLELWIASFNASHSLTTSTGYDCRVEEGGTAKGYQVKYSSSGSYGKSTSSNMVNYLVESPNLQAIYYNGGVTYWLASPSDNTYHTVMVTFFNGYLGNSYLSDPSSVRPLVSIPKSKISSQLTAE